MRRVAIIGGGVAGLQTARALRAAGLEPVVFEKAARVGGVWCSNYAGFGIQVPTTLYSFPGFPWGSRAAPGEYASGAKVQSYIEDYVAANALAPLVRTSTRVDALSPHGGGRQGWSVRSTHDGGGVSTTEEFDFAVIATGLYSSPAIPSFPGAGAFPGRVVHSTAFDDAAVVAASGKRVVVIGGAKSAIDCVLAASTGGARTATLVYRAPHWGTPQLIAGLIPFQWVFLSRFGQGLVSAFKGPWPTAPRAVHAAHAALSVVMRPVFAVVEALFAFQLGQRGPLLPDADVVADFYAGAHVLSSEFKAARASGAVTAVRGAVACLTPRGVALADGTELEADVVVCGTGFKREYAFLSLDVRRALGLDAPGDAPAAAPAAPDGVWLYRSIMPLAVANLAFVGSEVATISNIGTYALQAEWLARLLTGRLVLPPRAAIDADVAAHKAWARSWMPATPARGANVLLHQTHYHDALLKDMNIPHRRKGANVLAELFAPYTPQDYDGIIEGK